MKSPLWFRRTLVHLYVILILDIRHDIKDLVCFARFGDYLHIAIWKYSSCRN